tara:strand:+ start:45 stop:242 length:198 start_codon:yes stop_codon:yes gene_type:complete
MKLAGELLTIRQAAQMLFGDTSEASYRKAKRLIKSNNIETIQSGRTAYISKPVLESAFKIRVPLI